MVPNLLFLISQLANGAPSPHVWFHLFVLDTRCSQWRRAGASKHESRSKESHNRYQVATGSTMRMSVGMESKRGEVLEVSELSSPRIASLLLVSSYLIRYAKVSFVSLDYNRKRLLRTATSSYSFVSQCTKSNEEHTNKASI